MTMTIAITAVIVTIMAVAVIMAMTAGKVMLKMKLNSDSKSGNNKFSVKKKTTNKQTLRTKKKQHEQPH